jgi:L,D-transpeptidase catalytic domain/Putative peptidoglycan binding domain
MNDPHRPLEKRPSRPTNPGQSSSTTSWLPAIAIVTVLVVVIIAGAFKGGDDKGDAAEASTTTTVAGAVGSNYEVTGLTVPVSTLPGIGEVTTTAPVAKTNISQTLVQGMYGDDVKAVQTRLTELGFAPGVADGAFGDQTKQAVWAFEKLVLRTPSSQATGRVTNDTWQRMQDPIVIQPRRSGPGTHVEIYLPEQVAAVFTDNKPTLVIHISSGTAMTPDRTPENSWCETVRLDTDANGNPLDPPQEKAVCGVSYTPGGVFRFYKAVKGDRVGALGRMFNPIYFNYGIAMHGAQNVPLTPASHGCIRMNQRISDTFQDYVHVRDIVYVWGQDGKEPEQYTKRQSTPVFNYPDPSATTTTTTIKPTTTTVKPTTTTAKPVPTTATPTTTPPTTPSATVAPTTLPLATTTSTP